MATFHELAEQMSKAFEGGKRDNGDEFRKLKQDSPDWMQAVVRNAHGDMLPDDFRYRFIESAVDHFAEEDSDPDDYGEGVDSAVPVYNATRLQWIASNLRRANYVDDAVSEFGMEDFNLFQALGYGLYAEISEVFGQVSQALQDMVAADQEEDSE